MFYLSVDVGVTNLGIAYGENDLEGFLLYTFHDRSPVLLASELKGVITNLIHERHQCVLIVEKQMNANTKAFGIMYCLIGMCTGMGFIDVVMFDPIMKFAGMDVHYDSKKKEHKKLSAEMCRTRLLSRGLTDMVEEFDKLRKKDDVADAVNMLWSHLHM